MILNKEELMKYINERFSVLMAVAPLGIDPANDARISELYLLLEEIKDYK